MSLTAILNNQWAFHLVDQLILQGVYEFWIGPGSRNTPLVLAIANHPKSKSIVHFDERGLAYHALGFSKASRRPVAIVVTSGTAVGNLLPALMEAKESKIPLLILTADRPPELRDCGANQTTYQTGIFSKWTSWDMELVCPSSHVSIKYLRSVVSYCRYMLRKGSVHINCEFREPLFSDPLPIKSIPFCTYHENDKALSKDSLQSIANKINHVNTGLIILGEHRKDELFHVYPFIEKLQWPVYADLLSNERCYPPHKLITQDIAAVINKKIDCILQFGHKVISKALQSHIQKIEPSLHFLVSNSSKKEDDLLSVTDRITSDSKTFCRQILSLIKKQKPSTNIYKHKEPTVVSHPILTEPFIHIQLGKYFPKEHAIFFGNSMSVRDASRFFFPKTPPKEMFFHRGLSGIDGNVATCFGISKAIQAPLIAVLGDLTMLHDLNSLALVKESPFPVIFLVLNNQGGGIFSHLPISCVKHHFGKFFAAEHNFDFEKGASFFKIHYQKIETKEAFLECLSNGFSKKTQIIELKTSIDENLKHHQEIKTCSLSKQEDVQQKDPLSSCTGF